MKRFLIIAGVLIFLVPLISLADEDDEGELPEIDDAKILMIIAPDKFRDEELFIPKKIFEEQDAEVTIASSVKKEKKVRGMLGGKTEVDIHYSKVKVKEYDAVIFVGGAGATKYFDDETAHKIARKAVKEKKVLGAICIAPVILARAGLLKEKRATVWKSEKNSLKEMGAEYTGTDVEIDGDIITANGPKSAKNFAKAIVAAIAKKMEEEEEEDDD